MKGRQKGQIKEACKSENEMPNKLYITVQAPNL